MFQQGECYRELVLWGFGDDVVLTEVRLRYLVDDGGESGQPFEAARSVFEPWFHGAAKMLEESVIVEQERRERATDFDRVVVR
jgi:hypothetical protein